MSTISNILHWLKHHPLGFLFNDVDPTKPGTQTAFLRGLTALWDGVEPELAKDAQDLLAIYAAQIPTLGIEGAAIAMLPELAAKGIQLAKDSVMTLLRIIAGGLAAPMV